jgi:hypothetical protein
VVRMPKYEKIRNRILREKLAKPDEPKKSRVWAFVNSGIVLWALSAFFLTLGSGYFSNHAQCMRDSEQLIERRRALGEEIMARSYAFKDKVEAATNVQKMPFMPDNSGSASPELAKVPYLQLSTERVMLDQRVTFDNLPDDLVSKAKAAWIESAIARQNKIDKDFQKSVDGSKFKQDPTTLFKFRKLTAQLQFEQTHFDHELDALVYTFQPNCTPLNLVEFVLGYKPRIIEATASTLFADESIKGILRDHIKVITDLENQLTDVVSSM